MNKNVNDIVNALGKNSNYWAFTGSIALWYHSKHHNFEPRLPNDIDIVIEKSSRTYVSLELTRLGWKQQSEGSTRVTFTKGQKHLDLIFAGSRLAPSMNKVVHYRNSPPLMNIQSLFNRKVMITPNKGGKRNMNVKRLRNLGASTPKKSPMRPMGGRRLFN